jgi:hypothetical protein
MRKVTPSRRRTNVQPEKRVSFLRLAPVIEILRAAIWTGRLSDEKAVSVMLIAEQESAKTEMLKFFRNTSTLAYISDLTSRGLSKHKDAIERGRIRHLVLLDLVRIISHARSVQERTFQLLAALMEEGESETLDAGGSVTWEGFPRIGALMALTPKFFHSKRGRWRETGFLTRFLPISFAYSERTAHEIHLAIAAGHQLPGPHPEPLPEQNCQISIANQHALTLSRRSEELGKEMQSYGFRYQRGLRALAKAQARISGRGAVNDQDIGKVLSWSQFFTEKAIEL